MNQSRLHACAATVLLLFVVPLPGAFAQTVRPAMRPMSDYPQTKVPARPSRLDPAQQLLVQRIFNKLAQAAFKVDSLPEGPTICRFPTAEDIEFDSKLQRLSDAASQQLHALGVNVIPELVHGLYHRSRTVARMCAKTLASFGKTSVEQILSGCKYYGIDNQYAVQALQLIGPPAYDELTKAFSDPNQGVRRLSLHGLQQIGSWSQEKETYGKNWSEPSAANVRAIRQQLTDSDEGIKFFAISTLASIASDAETIDALAKVASDQKQQISARAEALNAIGSIARCNPNLESAAANVLTQQLKYSEISGLRAESARNLGKLSNSQSVAKEAWTAALRDQAPEVRQRCSDELAGKYPHF